MAVSSAGSTVLITGAAGFIGSHVAQAMLNRDSRVIGIDNFDPFYSRDLKQRTIDEILSSAHDRSFSLIEMDLCDTDAMDRVVAEHKPSGVIHLAAKAGVRPSIADPVGYARTNVLGTASVQSACARHGVERLVIASSSSVYGNNERVPFAEDDPVDHPISPYAATKKSCEMIAHAHWHLTQMPTAMLRFFTVFGSRQRPDLAINKFMRLIHAGQPITMFGDGSTSRDYTYIDDIVAGVLSAYDSIDRFGYRIWNLGGDHPIRLDDLIAEIGAVVGKEPEIRREPMQPGDVERTWADLTRARAELGYAPKTSIRQGLEQQWSWLRDRPA
ncbi:MAG TPA: NAD-dependent epimerase/dehydratase family protein [Phycisphaerales bacterium]|nr:NAD-dependent epimerase/dehydratase family protein [Phycisphaerales bacterium]